VKGKVIKDVEVVDPKTNEVKIVKKIFKDKTSLIKQTFKNENYREILKKMAEDPEWSKQFTIIKENNIKFLNSLYTLLKTRDPELANVKKAFSLTKNDADYFKMSGFIVPLGSLVKTTEKIVADKIWDDANYREVLRVNAFGIEMPKGGTSPTPENVMINWKYNQLGDVKDTKMSIRDFNEKMKIIILNFQKFTDIEDSIIKTKVVKELLVREEIINSDGTVSLKPIDIKKVKDAIERTDFLENLATFISFIKYPSQKGGLVIGLEKINDNLDKFKDPAFKELLSGDKSDDITFIFNKKDIYDDISGIYDSIKEIKTTYNSYSKEVKSVVDSNFLEVKTDQKMRAPFGVTIDEMLETVNEIKKFGEKFYKLKQLISTIKKEGEIPFTQEMKNIISINSKDLFTTMDRLANIIVRLQSIQRICGFINKYQSGQLHNLIDIDELDLSDESIQDYYVMASIDPEDQLAQSTFQLWSSCQNLVSGQTNFNQYVGSGFLLGNIVVYLLALDWSKPTGGAAKAVKTIRHSAIQDPKELISIEEFKEMAENGIMGTRKLDVRKFLKSYAIRPISRVLIKTFDLSPTGTRLLKPEMEMQGGTEEEIDTLKFVDNLYTPSGDIQMITKKGTAYGQSYSKYATLFYKSMTSVMKRMVLKSTPGKYAQRQKTYRDSPEVIQFSPLQKALALGEKVNFARYKTADLLSALNSDKNLLRYITFRHSLFSKDRIEGTLDLQGTTVTSLDPMHPTNLPGDVGLSDDKYQDIESMKGEWKVNDDYRKDSGDFTASLTKSELAQYK
jgi:hypothetical protein